MDVPSKRMTGIPLPSGEKAIGLLSGPSAAGTNILAITRNQNAHSSSVFQISVDNKATLLFTQPGAIATSAQASFKSGVMVYSLQSSTEPGDLWRAQLSHGSPQKMTGNGAGFDAVNLATARVVEWKGADGVARKAALLLPANYRPGEKLPLVVWSYGGEKGSDFIDTYGFWGPGNFDMQVLATRGYAVLSPDLPINIGSPMHDIFTGTMNAVDELVSEGIADPDRMAIMGQSYGSYSTLSTITQTTRFKAAVISSVLVPDLMTDYLYMSPNGQGVATDGVEHGQIRMGATPWENPGRYIDNSPIWKFDRIETPLLMALGTEDGATNFDGANGTFVALQRLGKEAEYRLYQGEGHGFLQPEDVMDWWNRRIAFLDEKLGVVRDHDGMMLMPATRGNEKSK
jgi:dipeptidyl aminopeptidase/acylaminoacyl peptidase